MDISAQQFVLPLRASFETLNAEASKRRKYAMRNDAGIAQQEHFRESVSRSHRAATTWAVSRDSEQACAMRILIAQEEGRSSHIGRANIHDQVRLGNQI